ncbi:MAG: hypothetical protein E7265_11820 [Lachnospiraceae bacterium]|nr:hypothetical protein [Lachnospiraceae bacterium]
MANINFLQALSKLAEMLYAKIKPAVEFTSGETIVIGKFDGKPLYRDTIIVNDTRNISSQPIMAVPGYIDMLVRTSACIYIDNGSSAPPLVEDITKYVYHSYSVFICSSDLPSKYKSASGKLCFIIEYTKTK